jgi:hypothetical protein
MDFEFIVRISAFDSEILTHSCCLRANKSPLAALFLSPTPMPPTEISAAAVL